MADVEITVRGTAGTTHPPERATVYLAASTDGPDRDAVHAEASRLAKALTDSITPLANEKSGPIRRWVGEQLRVYSQREFDGRTNRPGRVVHHADVEFRVRFDDFDALQSWLESVVAMDGVEVRHVEWSLTRALREQLTEQAREAAVRDAQQRAAAYARDLGLENVRPVAIADPGLLGVSGEHGGVVAEAVAARRYSMKAGGMHVEFRPEDIEVQTAVDVRFMAS